MKPLSKYLLVALLCLTTAASYSQANTKPSLFANQADRIELSETMLRDAFNSRPGETITFNLSSTFTITGVVLSNEAKYSNLTSVVVRATEFDNALLHISKVVNEDNSISYVGRIMNERAADGFEIKKEASGYSFQKFQTARILQDCNY
jgi:hypothetical protein